MSQRLDSLLQRSGFIEQVDSVVYRLFERRTCWALIDAEDPALQARLIHCRPYLEDAGLAPGYRLDKFPLTHSNLPRTESCVRVFLKPVDQAHLANFLEAVSDEDKRRSPYVALFKADESDDWLYIDDDGQRHRLDHVNRKGSVPLSLGFQWMSTSPLQAFLSLPCAIEASVDTPAAVLSIRVLNSTALECQEYHFHIRSKFGRKLGRCVLILDADLAVSRPDTLKLEVKESASDVDVHVVQTPPVEHGENLFNAGQVHLHILYDRTTLDAEAWGPAFASSHSQGGTFGPVARESDNSFYRESGPVAQSAQPDRSPSAWNIDLRTALGSALQGTLGSLHDPSTLWIHLSWFADRPQDGITVKEGMPYVDQAVGEEDDLRIVELPETLLGPSYDYVSGLDLHDAVDEALDRVMRSIKGRQEKFGEQHAVLIIGDSPPPPPHDDEADERWKELLTSPIRTNARRSPLFRRALEALRDRQVPVAWLFIRAKLPDDMGRYAPLKKSFSVFDELNKRVFKLLKNEPDLIVELSDGLKKLKESLEKLFNEMKHRPSPVSWFEIKKIKSGIASS